MGFCLLLFLSRQLGYLPVLGIAHGIRLSILDGDGGDNEVSERRLRQLKQTGWLSFSRFGNLLILSYGYSVTDL